MAESPTGHQSAWSGTRFAEVLVVEGPQIDLPQSAGPVRHFGRSGMHNQVPTQQHVSIAPKASEPRGGAARSTTLVFPALPKDWA